MKTQWLNLEQVHKKPERKIMYHSSKYSLNTYYVPRTVPDNGHGGKKVRYYLLLQKFYNLTRKTYSKIVITVKGVNVMV